MQDHPIRIDGLLNATLCTRSLPAAPDSPIFAVGRKHMAGPLAVCQVFPEVAHAAYVEMPDGHVLEDPRFVGVWEDSLVFMCADAAEYFADPQPQPWRIYQAVAYLDPETWRVRRVWRVELPGASGVEKNWVPLGLLGPGAAGRSRVLYSHDTCQIAELDHAARTARSILGW